MVLVLQVCMVARLVLCNKSSEIATKVLIFICFAIKVLICLDFAIKVLICLHFAIKYVRLLMSYPILEKIGISLSCLGLWKVTL